MAPARGLGDVLHFFIPEDEQRGARERAAVRSVSPASGPCWGLLAEPGRPALCALAVDLGAVLAPWAHGATLLAPFGRAAVLPRASEVRWESCADVASSLLGRLEAQAQGRAVVVLVPPDRLRAILDDPAARALDGLLVPVDASARGAARALGWLHRAGSGAGRTRIGALLIGAATAEQAEALGQQLARKARRELGLDVQLLGHLERDETSYRSLLAGRSVVELDSASPASRSLRALAERLARWRG